MKNFFFFTVLFFLSIIGIGQESTTVEMPNFTPVSPEASKYTVYGDIPINLSSGQMNLQVPIYTIKSGTFSWPIDLNYNYSGLTLNGEPSLSGLGWFLKAGGSITREVRGLPDEQPSRGYYSYGQSIVSNYVNNGLMAQIVVENIKKGAIDVDPDVYHISVADISISFKLKKTGNNYVPIFLTKRSDVKVSFDWNSIDVISKNGVKYVFQDVEYTRRYGGIEDNIFDDHFQKYPSSWQLSKIVLVTNEEINFNYSDDSRLVYNYSASGRAAYFPNGAPNDPSCIAELIEPGYKEYNGRVHIDSKIIDKIDFPNGSINFSTIPKGGIGNDLERDVFQEINIEDVGNNEIIEYKFDYQGNRDLLTEITKNNLHYYSFEYDNINTVPPFLNGLIGATAINPWAKDKWGFYNSNNLNVQFGVDVPQSSINGPSRNPHLSSTKLGALTKITYPTKGTTDISYEQNQVREMITPSSGISENLPLNRSIQMYLYSTPENPVTLNEFTYTFTEPTLARLSHFLEKVEDDRGSIKIDITVENTSGFEDGCPQGTAFDYYQRIDQIRTFCNIDLPKVWPQLHTVIITDDVTTTSPPGIISKSEDSRGKFIILPGTYTFKISIPAGAEALNTYDANIYLSFHESLSSSPYYVNKDVGGIRVSKTEDCPDESGTNCVTRYFDYNDQSGISRGELLQQGYYTKSILSDVTCGSINYSVDYYETISTTYNSVNLNSGIPIMYQEVSEYKDRIQIEQDPGNLNYPTDTNPDGSLIFNINGNQPIIYETIYPEGIKKHNFDRFITSQDTNWPFTPNPKDKSLGRQTYLEDYTYSRIDSSQTLNQSKNMGYYPIAYDQSVFEQNNLWGIKIGFLKPIHSGTIFNANEVDNYYVVKPYQESNVYGLQSYIENKSIYTTQEIKSTTSYYYDNPQHYQPTRIVSTTSENNKTRITKTDYPQDTAVANDPYMSNLRNANRIAEPVQVRTYTTDANGENEKLLGTQKTVYHNYSGLIFPRYIKTLKEGTTGQNTLENRIIYHGYDSYSNPTEVSQPDGMRTSYIWGYNGQYPVAKIENRTYSSIPTNLITNIHIASNTGTEASLIAALNALRSNLSDAMLTTYTYKPLIGLSTITDPRGYRVNYFYDDHNRLELVKDADGNLVNKNEYNYKN